MEKEVLETSLHWTEYFKAIGPTIIALFVAYIAYQQWRVSKDTFREKMFDRRMTVFEKVSDAIALVIRDGGASAPDGKQVHFSELGTAWHTSKFLFGKEVSDYIWDFRDRLIKVRYHEETMAHTRIEGPQEEYQSHVSQKHALLNEIFKHEQDKAYAIFSQYLAFKR
ncbi:hypothetical protein CEW89_19315 [Celeribacter ethanolicus]|uniref:DUF4760 domain-containing protein n=1 Tax=Celeribacter ethanolicus TaxID=1758178 RepID=A0A291GHQ2_9RHOB|nr:hypothetical protein [Celeribacter ethanolicus]ATG49534.1 hypothetical protein CEW89_19315 [Celeribacter ethanolicus]